MARESSEGVSQVSSSGVDAKSKAVTASGRIRRGQAVAVATAVLVVAIAGVLLGYSRTRSDSGSQALGFANHTTTAAVCKGPAGYAYVADAGWDGFSQVNTANCAVLQTYNVGDTYLPGNTGDQNYSSTDESEVSVGSNLYFADTGSSNVAVIDAADLSPSNYNPSEQLINVGLFPDYLAALPNGSQLWVADTGPQTATTSPAGISIISVSSNKVIKTISLTSAPQQIAFSPNGAVAYVTTATGLEVIDTSNYAVSAIIGPLDSPEGVAVSPQGNLVYVTESAANVVLAINPSTNKVVKSIAVGELPWRVIFNAAGNDAYVADSDSNDVAVINTNTSRVADNIAVNGDPVTVALTPNGSELWVGENAAGNVDVISTVTRSQIATVDLGLGYEPMSIVIPPVSGPTRHP
jgi:YVTN family beta-propeller protein